MDKEFKFGETQPDYFKQYVCDRFGIPEDTRGNLVSVVIKSDDES